MNAGFPSRKLGASAGSSVASLTVRGRQRLQMGRIWPGTRRALNGGVMRSIVAILSLSSLLMACGGPSHIRPYTERNREYRTGRYETTPEPVSVGSLWLDSSRGLFADFRANRVGDILTVRVDENPSAAGDASTQLDRESSMNWGLNNLFGLTSAITSAYPDVNPAQLLNIVNEYSFSGQGQTSRSSNVQAQIAVRVKQQLPNGDLFIEGTKILMVNDEELHVYISGVIRPEDLQSDNSVPSSLVADAQIEFTGRGNITRNQEEGWLSEFLQTVNPF